MLPYFHACESLNFTVNIEDAEAQLGKLSAYIYKTKGAPCLRRLTVTIPESYTVTHAHASTASSKFQTAGLTPLTFFRRDFPTHHTTIALLKQAMAEEGEEEGGEWPGESFWAHFDYVEEDRFPLRFFSLELAGVL